MRDRFIEDDSTVDVELSHTRLRTKLAWNVSEVFLGAATLSYHFQNPPFPLFFPSHISIMVSITSERASRDVHITDRTWSMSRAILAGNCIADIDDTILEQEMVMFFKCNE